MNHLAKEKSPYLMQHANNPVDWYPWGEEAFELARKEDKPIFLSIGYATCHWCHVMEKESFENPDIAKRMNETFINIKVDREELPQVDNFYMEFAQAMMSSPGGWPLNILLTPDLKPFFAVTYLPPSTKKGLMGLTEFCEQIHSLWTSEEKNHLIDQAEELLEIMEHSFQAKGEELPDEMEISYAAQNLFSVADENYGGIKGEPKFPLGYQAEFLLQYAKAKKDSRAIYFVELTLGSMYKGGIYDHLGGGFSRYSIDEKWQIPHFEKMLYDNAILAKTYCQAWKYTKKENYKKVFQGIIEYVLREMTHPDGGFYSAEDADSDGHEGLFYTWDYKEILDSLKEDGETFCHAYGVTKEGNFEGRNVLHLVNGDEGLESCKKILFEERSKRNRPFKDDKILSSWNGLMIDAMASTGYTDAALKAAEFIKKNLWKEGRLFRRFRDGEARFSAGLDEYAFMIKGVLSLYEAGMGDRFLEWALEMTKILEIEFKAEHGAFYQTDSQETLLFRKCDFYDGAEPSGNGVHLENLLRLYQATFNEHYLTQAEDILKAAHEFMKTFPPGTCYHYMGLQRYYDKLAPTVAIVLDESRSLEKEIKELLSSKFCPHAFIMWNPVDKKPIDGQTTVYICTQGVCNDPLIKKEDIVKAIQAL